MNYFMNLAKQNAQKGVNKEEGGPFGAVIIDKEGNIISNGNNKVLIQKDPTAHAEIVAIREACKKLDTYDLSEYILYVNCEPCPMCLSAIIWSNIKEIYFGTDRKEVANIGFRDDFIYEYIKHPNNALKVIKIENEDCKNILKEYKNTVLCQIVGVSPKIDKEI